VKKITIAIDGFSSCGKSTLAKDLAAVLEYGYIDSGAMYRSVTLYLLENEVDIHDLDQVHAALPKINIAFQCIDGKNYTFLNDRNVEGLIRNIKISHHVSIVAAIPKVRQQLVTIQRHLGKNKGIVMDGRDIGTVVFPDAEVKLFLDSDLSIRVERRYQELLEKGLEAERSVVEANLIERDHIDSTRKESPLRKAKDAVLIDNTNLTKTEQLAMVLALIHTRTQS